MLKVLLIGMATCTAAYLLLIMFVRPSNDRDWNDDQALLPHAGIIQSALPVTPERTGTKVSIRNIRNFAYTSTSEYVPAYYDKTFDLDRLKRVWFVVEPFSGFAGAAHTFLSFEFEKDPSDQVSPIAASTATATPTTRAASTSTSEFLAISVEIRKEKGESFSAIKGLLRRYELMYVAADEKDVIKLRSNYRKDSVYLYPIKADKSKAQALFLDMSERMNKLETRPEFYNTLTNTCTTNIVSHVNKISPQRIPFSLEVLFPAASDKRAYDIGLIDTDLSFEEARKKFQINERAIKYADDPDFSAKIRADE